MKAVLIVTQENKQVAKVILTKSPFVLGRAKTADLVLEDVQASREHALLTRAGKGFQIVDNASRNGTRLNGDKLTAGPPCDLKDGDVIGIGPFEIRFLVSDEAAPEPEVAEEPEDSEATRFVAAPNLSDRVKGMGGPKPKGTLDYGLVATSGAIRGTKFRNWEGPLTLGRGMNNVVIIPDDAASTQHAQIEREGQGFVLQDKGSANGTFLDGARIQREALKDGHKIRVGNTTFVFSVADLEQKRKVKKIALIALGGVMLLAIVIKLLIPKDQVAELLNLGEGLLQNGQYADARVTFEQALAMRPNDPRGMQLLDQAQRQEEIEALLVKAQAAAESERFDEALETCYAIFRLDSSNQAARDLEEVIKAIGEARLALEVRNWADAIRLLDKASASYPSSELLKRLQGRSREEQGAAACVERAQAQLLREEYQTGKAVLAGVATSSVYYAEAQALIRRADLQMAYTSASREARELYRGGRTADALSSIERALRDAPGDKELVGLRARINQVVGLMERVRGAAALAASDDVAAIKGGVALCQELLLAEVDPVNAFHVESAQVADTLGARLKSIGAASMAEGETKQAGGDRKGAVLAFERAVSADATLAQANDAAAALRKQMVVESQKHFREGQAFEELGQNERAIAAYKRIIGLSLPGESYYDRAVERLRRLE